MGQPAFHVHFWICPLHTCKLHNSEDIVLVLAVVHSIHHLLNTWHLCEVEEEGWVVIDGDINQIGVAIYLYGDYVFSAGGGLSVRKREREVHFSSLHVRKQSCDNDKKMFESHEKY